VPGSTTPLRQPPEWAAHRACWLAWPSDAELWRDELGPAQRELTGLARAIADDGGERLEVLVPDAAREAEAQAAIGPAARLHRIPFGDIWLRDIAPIFARGPEGVVAVRFGFNGWGGKYVLPHDTEVAERIASASGLPERRHNFVLEGGALDTDGAGTFLTTRQCLLNPNRGPIASERDVEARLSAALGATRVIWLERGLQNDHTDGHVDTLARFVREGAVIAMEPRGKEDPNREVLLEILDALRSAKDAAGRALVVATMPSAGEVLDPSGRLMPASYANFYIGNRTVVVPTYGDRADDEAVAAIGRQFPGRTTVGRPARAILSGGGAFHCITQQEPAP
jgi:agmatine deiminase